MLDDVEKSNKVNTEKYLLDLAVYKDDLSVLLMDKFS